MTIGTGTRKETNVSKRIFVTMFACGLVAVLLAGCCPFGAKAVSDEEQVKAQLEAFKAALLGKDIDALAAVIADDFYHYEAGDKESILDYVQQGIDQGIVDDGEIDLESVEITIDGDKATAYPIEASAPIGSVTVELELKKVDGKWLFSGGDAEGV